MAHIHSHDHDHHGHDHHHGHSHGAAPHPAQVSPCSIMRMSLPGRLAAALVVSAVLWGVVLLAMRPS